MTPEELERRAKLAFGDRWVVDLSIALSREKGSSVSVAQVSNWKNGQRPIPSWVRLAMINVMTHARQDLQRRAWLIAADQHAGERMSSVVFDAEQEEYGE